jgi:hypothetical protein
LTTQQATGSGMREAVLASFPGEPRHARTRQLMADQSLDCNVAAGKQNATWLPCYSRRFARALGCQNVRVGPL